MIRNRFPRFRNLQNLHVIPTASNIILNSTPIPTVSQSPNITILPHISNTTVDISNTNTEKKMFNQNKRKGRFNKARKNRNKRKKGQKFFPPNQTENQDSCYWYNPDYLNQPDDNHMYSQPPAEKIEEIENNPDIPIEEDFEEVEVASVDADGKQDILVGFRASKLQYLNYKKNCFFKPKFYKFGSQRTVVSLNMQDSCSVDIDIVSEAEYEIEETDNLDQGDSQDQQISKLNEESLKSGRHSGSNQKEIPAERSKVIEVNVNNDLSINTSKEAKKSTGRIYKACIEQNADIKQGQCLIQSSLDTWKSHLIGLEYLVEIRDKNKAKYYCMLCSQYLQVKEIPDINVINHTNGYKHVIRYLVKHFPSYGFKFDENCAYNVAALQKICEEINEKMGYFSMCITNLDCFDKNKQKIKNIVLNASHINEENLKLDKDVYQKAIDHDTLKNVQDVVEGIVEKVVVSEKNSMVSECALVEGSSVKLENEVSHIPASKLQSDSLNKAGKIYMHKKSISKNSKSFLKYRGNSNLSSYLKVKYAKAKSKGLKPVKGLSNRTKRLSAEGIDSREKMYIGRETSKLEQPGEVVSDFICSDISKKVLGNKEKVLQKPTVHSKHCRKRILGRETTRLKVTAKASTKDEFISSTLKKSKEKCIFVSEFENPSSSKKNDQSVKSNETVAVPSNNSSSVQKVASVPTQKVSKQDPKVSIPRHSKNSHRAICKKGIESSVHEKDMMVRNSSSHWKIMTRSPVKSPVDNSYVSKNENRKHSRSPVKRTVRKLSKSPLRLVHRSPIRKVSKSPVRKHSRSPLRRKSRSPYKKLSKSPVRRKSRSPFWKHSRSPLRKKSRSPIRKHSRSPPGRRSRSPVRRFSRSSFRRHSRSPLRRFSRSPKRRYSRSPLRRRLRSPIRRRSRSPRRCSRSPLRRHSRSPVRRHSRSPVRRHSRSPVRRHSRSPVRRHSRSPVRQHSRSPIKRFKSPIRMHSRGSLSVSDSPPKEFRNIYKVTSSNIGHSGNNQSRIVSDERYSQNVYKYEHLGKHGRECIKVRSSKIFHSPSSSAPDKHKSHSFVTSTVRGISDLDPVSDEDESIYFDKQRVEECSSSSKKMLAQFLEKFSVPNVNPDDPSLNKLMIFMEAHSAEIQELIGSQSSSKAGKASAKIDSSVQERNLILQQYLLSNLAGSSQEPGSSLNLNKKTKYQQPPFLSGADDVGCGLVHTMAPHIHPQVNLPRFFPPNVNVPPPDPYRPFNQPHQEFSPKSQVPPEVMFKDLKATVSKLFGANESVTKLEKKKSLVPEYVTEPDPEKWDLNHPDTLKFNAPAKFSGHIGPRFNAPINQKNVFHSQGNSDNFTSAPESSVMRADMPITYNSSNSPGQFFSGRGIERSQGQNVTVPPPDAKVSFCDVPRSSSKGNLFPVVHNVNSNFSSPSTHGSISDVKVSLAQRLASVLVKFGMIEVPAPLLQEMLMKIGAFSSLPRHDISEAEIISILKRLGYLLD